ncbi:MAG: UDP-N-acetylglucosamine 1-carboxyvinyltransferase [Saprospiraceae bacterium]|nr:UDP-N-acetylglucosamine 1-carboxyvinyltransferase [Saprospiraceae bacterium]
MSDSFLVQGGVRLSGSIEPQGAKNEALQVVCAVLLSSEDVEISNIPDILDIRLQMELLKGLGVKIEQLGAGRFRFNASDVNLDYLSSPEYLEKAKRIRGSVLLLGTMLGRFGRAYLPKPGGDKIGRRNLDAHFHGFERLGATFTYNEEEGHFFIDGSRMEGNFIYMDEISVTGTGNVLMASVLTPGKTTIYNAACEPYLQQLCKMLVGMGAKIQGVGSNMLIVEGVERLHGTNHRCLPDMIEIGSFIGMAAMTQSALTITNASVKDLGLILPTFKRLGLELEVKGDDIHVPEQDVYKIQTFIDGSVMTIYDAPWPGFTPDLMSVVLVVATQARGSVLIHQKMFESRLFFTDKLIEMGAKIILCDPHRATVIGLERKSTFRAINMTSPDIRAGISLLIAAMSAKGVSRIDNIQQIDRGYQQIESRLNAIGARIERIQYQS